MSQAPRQGQRQQGDEPQTPNQQISNTARAQDRMKALLLMIRERRDEIEAVLPPDVAYSKFEAVFNMAVRREPKLLDCYGPSLIAAVIRAAYDGLLPDGNQAVILYSNNKIPNTNKSRLEARYQSMVYGLRLKLVQAGAVTFIDAKVVYAKEHFRHEEGLNPVLEHIPILDEKERGDPIAAYAIATLPDGTRVFDVMSKGIIMAARDVAKTKNVWDGPFWAEMWKKTAIRRLSKAVPTARVIRDAEAMDMFPQFQSEAQLGLPAPARPTRGDFKPAGLEHREEVPLDLNLKGFETEDYDSEESRRAMVDDPPAETKTKKKAAAKKAEPDAGKEEGGADRGGQDPDPPVEEARTGTDAKPDKYEPRIPIPDELPRDEAGWTDYLDLLKGGVPDLPDADAINAERRAHQDMIDAAPTGIANKVADVFADALADLV